MFEYHQNDLVPMRPDYRNRTLSPMRSDRTVSNRPLVGVQCGSSSQEEYEIVPSDWQKNALRVTRIFLLGLLILMTCALASACTRNQNSTDTARPALNASPC